MKLGEFNLRLISDGVLWVDGGMMFGAAPKTVWSRLVKCDDRNRIPLALNCLLVETPQKRVLIEAGAGLDSPPEFRELYSLECVKGIGRRIEEIGLKAGDIDTVIFTHLHFDHVDGALETVGGRRAPVFPRAECIVQAGEWRDAFNTNEFTASGYNERVLTAVQQTGRLRLIEGDVEVCQGVRVWVTGGHTAHHQIVLLESQGEKAAFLGDFIPTAAHLPTLNISALDVDPLKTLAAKRLFLRRAAAERILCFFGHDKDIQAGYVRAVEGDFVLDVSESVEGPGVRPFPESR